MASRETTPFVVCQDVSGSKLWAANRRYGWVTVIAIPFLDIHIGRDTGDDGAERRRDPGCCVAEQLDDGWR
jgi:hypothetical protein